MVKSRRDDINIEKNAKLDLKPRRGDIRKNSDLPPIVNHKIQINTFHQMAL